MLIIEKGYATHENNLCQTLKLLEFYGNIPIYILNLLKKIFPSMLRFEFSENLKFIKKKKNSIIYS